MPNLAMIGKRGGYRSSHKFNMEVKIVGDFCPQ